ncbi:sugar transferase [Lederbergia sp. NSJ-179]|uniref:sugar transferase n=1 Tax=Lederbergia sp. NSJ-179 TaxID=2931402 RepID=UPI001FD1F465|nr:sugar transferase [Lederbergia sp. NSJ-179]MCJ7840667.1 sugar transferase [Lederbergia sp. NSJ-179]
MYQKYFKRLLDFIFALILIILLLPLMLIIGLVVRINLGSPIIFKQERTGLNEKTFTLNKFRSMTDERDENGELLPNELRMTRFSKIFRSTSLDELPELFNILKGEMSFIGPRPLLTEYLELYNKDQRKRHKVRPGLTSYTAVNGRSTLSWDQRFEMDVWYVENVSFLLDFKILVKTFITVIKRENTTSDRGKFQGTADANKEKSS